MDKPSRGELLAIVESAVAAKKLSASAATNIRHWLTEPQFQDFSAELSEHLHAGKWRQLEDAFWTVLPFGTAGRRGPMYPIGTATINDRTIGESAQGLADYVRSTSPSEALGCAIAYDTRHRSRDFAVLCCEVTSAAGFTVYFLDDYRATPELSFAVRHLKCQCGIMVSASHNPPRDNAVKVFGPNGGQLRSPADLQLMQFVEAVSNVHRQPFADGLRDGRIVCRQDEIDGRYQAAVFENSFPGPRNIRILYSPLHGVGLTSVVPVLHADGFSKVEVFAPHATADGDFPNVVGNTPNPENPAVFAPLIEHAKQIGSDLVVASDPDADRIGCAAPLAAGGEWQVLNGNQIGVLLAEYVLRHRRALGTLGPQNFLVKTLVTTEMVRRIGDLYGVRTIGNVPTGFKWISAAVDEYGPDHFVFGFEEAHGYIVGNYIRDKDAAAAAMLLAELTAELIAERLTLFQQLDRLFAAVGYHEERSFSCTLPGAEGQARMQAIMARLRRDPPKTLGGIRVVSVRDFAASQPADRADSIGSATAPPCDLVFLDLEPTGNCVGVRPSGTEPKLKFYLFAYASPSGAGLDDTRDAMRQQLAAVESDLRRLLDN
jgi:phosphomannomutase